MLYIKNNKVKNIKNIVIVTDKHKIFNPSEDQVIADGWQPYTPPTPEYPEISQEEQYKNRIVELIREKYSVNDELAILRQRDFKIDEFNVYNTFVEECKVTARREIYGDEFI